MKYMEVFTLAEDIDKQNKKNNLFKKYNLKWVIVITIWTFFLTMAISIISESIMRNFEILLAIMTLLIIIIIGVVFDILGIAVAASNEKSFHSMAANKVEEAKYAIRLVRNAGPVSNFCNDVVGDISGIISGAAGTIIVLKLINQYGFKEGTLISIVMSGLIASLTVGGKAFGKEIGISKAEKILFFTSRILRTLDHKFNINLLPDLKKKKNK